MTYPIVSTRLPWVFGLLTVSLAWSSALGLGTPGPSVEIAARDPARDAPPPVQAADERAGRAAGPADDGGMQGVSVGTPRSLPSAVDEGPDLLRQRRKPWFDAHRGRYSPAPPGFIAYDQAVERFRDRRRQLHRRRGDWPRFRQNSWMDALCPWPKPRGDRSRRRNFPSPMERFDRRAYRDASVFGAPFAYGPAGLR